MLFSEMVRQISGEENLIDDGTEYSRKTDSWGTLHDYGSINLPEAGLIAWNCEIKVAGGGAHYRLKVGAQYVWGTYITDTDYVGKSGVAWVGAGSKAVVMESRGNAVNYHYIRNLKLGGVDLKDSVGEALAIYSSQITKQVAGRKLAVGLLNEAVFAVVCWAKTPGEQTNFENVGDSLTNGVSISIDGQQKNWTWRQQDTTSIENAAATHFAAYSVGSNHTIVITKNNANTEVHISVIGCPWLLIDELRQPIALDFAQGSTLYLVLEPLNSNPIKYVWIGKKRAVSFSDSTDYYSTASGTGILSHSYTFETVEVEEALLFVKGFGGCISILAVDER